MTVSRERMAAAAVALAVFILDQASKAMVRASFSVGQSKPVWGEILRITYVLNPQGLMGLSLGAGTRYLLLPLSILAAVAILILFFRWHRAGMLAAVSLGLILAGAAGNILDRLRWGAVVDFIDCDIPDIVIPAFRWGFLKFPGYALERWYTFNIADSAVLVGVTLLLVLSVADSRKEAAPEAEAGCS